MNHDWTLRAACHGLDPELWFAEDRQTQRAAKNICALCPVVWQCLDEALATDDNHAYGIRAGLTGRERRGMRQQQKRPTYAATQKEARKEATRALIAQGHTTTSIAADLGVDKRTVRRWQREWRTAA